MAEKSQGQGRRVQVYVAPSEMEMWEKFQERAQEQGMAIGKFLSEAVNAYWFATELDRKRIKMEIDGERYIGFVAKVEKSEEGE